MRDMYFFKKGSNVKSFNSTGTPPLTRSQIIVLIQQKNYAKQTILLNIQRLIGLKDSYLQKYNSWDQDYRTAKDRTKDQRDDKNFKKERRDTYYKLFQDTEGSIKTEKGKIEILDGEIATLQSTLNAINQEMQSLASKGLSGPALEIEAAGKVQEQLRKAEADIEAQKKATRNKRLIWTIVIIVLVILTVRIIRKRLKK
jgi:hypothetical protein